MNLEYCHNNICYEGEGDCDDGNVGGTDSVGCADGLTCGVDNCDFGDDYSAWDCCCVDSNENSICDVNEDGMMNVLDIVSIVNMIMGN